MAKSLSTFAQSKRRRGFRPLSTALKAPTKKLAGKRGFYDQFLIGHWNEIIGAELGAITRPYQMKSTRAGTATLVLECVSGYVAELNMRETEMCMKINAALGGEVVNRIVLRHNIAGFAEEKPKFTPAPMREVEVPNDMKQTAKQVAAPALRDALDNITKAFYNKG